MSYLLLILPLQMKPGLDVASGLLEGLSLGNFSRVVGTDADDVGAQEDENVSTHLERAEQGDCQLTGKIKRATFTYFQSPMRYFPETKTKKPRICTVNLRNFILK